MNLFKHAFIQSSYLVKPDTHSNDAAIIKICLLRNLCLGIAFGGSLWVILENQSYYFLNQILFLTRNDIELDDLFRSPEFILCDLSLFPKKNVKEYKIGNQESTLERSLPAMRLLDEESLPSLFPAPPASYSLLSRLKENQVSNTATSL